MCFSQKFKMMKIVQYLVKKGLLLVPAMLVLASFSAHAKDYIFPGTLPAGCSQLNTTTFSCSIVTLAAGDNIIVNSSQPIEINFAGALTIGDGSSINVSPGTQSKLTLNFSGVFTVGTNSRVNAIVYSTSAVTVGADSEIGPVTTTAGVVAIGIGSRVNGSIETKAGGVTLGANSVVKGRIETEAGVVTVGNNSTVDLGIKTDAGAITLGDFVRAGGNLETPTGVITLGANTTVAGSIKTFTATTQGAGAVNVGDRSSIGGNIETDAGVVTLTTNVRVIGSVITVAGAITVGDRSEICGDAITTGAGVMTMTNVHVGGRVSTVGGGVTMSGGSTVGGSVKITGAGVLILTDVKVGGDIRTVAGAINLTNSNIRGTVEISGAGVKTIIGGTTEDNTVSVPAGGCPITTTNVHHYQLSVPSSSISCMGANVEVKACADGSNPCTSIAQNVSGSTTLTMTTPWFLGIIATSTTVTTQLSNGVGTAVLSNPAGLLSSNKGTVRLSDPTYSASHDTTCSDDPNCATIFKKSGFIFGATPNGSEVTLPTQVAGTSSSNYYLRAVTSSGSACQGALDGRQEINLAYQCKNPGSCHGSNMMKINDDTIPIQRNNGDAKDITFKAVNLNFDNNGNAPLNFVYNDVGLVKLLVSKNEETLLGQLPIVGQLLDFSLSGTSNPFVVKPGGFKLFDIKTTAVPEVKNPKADSATGAVFIKAGQNFTVSVQATTTSGVGTPSYGREVPPQKVVLKSQLVVPSDGVNGELGGDFSTFINGTATGTQFTWNEVGIIELTAGVADTKYLGVDATVSAVSENVGRFIPDHFKTTVTQACLAGEFTYSAQPFAFNVQAMSLGNSITRNYDGKLANSFAKDLTFSKVSSGESSVGTLSPSSFSASNFDKGEANFLTPRFTFNKAETAPTSIQLKVIDTDKVESVTNTNDLVLVRSGRIKPTNRYGSEKSALLVPWSLEYWTASGWVKNSADSCTKLASNNFSFSFPDYEKNKLTACATAITLSRSDNPPGYLMSLSKPLDGRSGWVDITLNLGSQALDPSETQCLSVPDAGPAATSANLPWLQTQIKRNGVNANANPKARVTFGVYKSPLIYRRENH